MTKAAKQLYDFGPYRLDVAERLLLRAGEPVELTAKVFDLLVVMVENQGRLLEKSYLLDRLWPDSFVEEVNLSVNISALRKALGENPSSPLYIETVPKRGYRFFANVVKLPVADEMAATGREMIEAEAAAPGAAQADLEKENAAGPARSPQLSAPKAAPARMWIIIGAVLVIAAAVAAYFLWPKSGRINKAGASSAPSIAVLPFKTLTTDEADKALAVGMSDALITRLGRLQQLTVRPTASVVKYFDSSYDPLVAGRELGVEVVLSGLLQRSDKTIRVSVQLQRVADGATLWSDKFDDYFSNIFAVQDSISEKMAEALSIRLNRDEQQLLTKRYTENTEAYQLYVQGLFFNDKATPEMMLKAADFYKAAIAKDPEYALAMASLSSVYYALTEFNIDRDQNMNRARQAATDAISLDPNMATAYGTLGHIKLKVDWDPAGAERLLRRATEIEPRNAGAHHSYSVFLSQMGRDDEAISEMELALEYEPAAVYIHADMAAILINARRYDQAIERAKKAIELDPRYVFGHRSLSRAYAAKGMMSEAVGELNEEVELGGLKKRGAFVGYIYARAGKRAEAEAILRDYLASFGRPGINNYGVALIYNGLGDRDRAIQWISKAFKERDSGLFHLRTLPEWDNMRSDPRFQELINRLPN